jgi:hypothetical protein
LGVLQREWTIFLGNGSRIVVFLDTARSETLSFAVVLIAEVDGEEVCVTRYDTAHSQPHRDVLGRRAGLIEKEWLLISNNKDAFGYAVADLRANHERYLQFYLQH